MWHTVLVTATEFDNFFELRCPKYTVASNYKFEGEKEPAWKDTYFSKKDFISGTNMKSLNGIPIEELTTVDWLKMSKSAAEIHIQALAESMWDAYNESEPNQLQPGEWHIPFNDNINDDEILQKIAKKEEVEHLETAYDIYQHYAIKIATARCARLSYMTFEGEIDYAKDIALHDSLLKSHHMSPFEHCARAMTDIEYHTLVKGKIEEDESKNDPNIYGWCDNFRGFIPYRHLVEPKND